MLEKINWFRLTGLKPLVLLMSKWIHLFLRKNYNLRCGVGLSLRNQIEALSYIIPAAKTASKKIGALILSLNFLSSEVSFIFINLPCKLVWNTAVISGLILPVASSIQYRSGSIRQLVVHLLPFLNPWLIFRIYTAGSLLQVLLWQIFI